MADITDVMNVLVGVVAQTVYPNGTSQPSIAGIDIICYAGWPTASRLDQDLQREKVHITVFPTGTEKNTTRYQPIPKVMSIVAPSLTLAASANTVTVGGAIPSPFTAHNMAVLIARKAFIYPVQSTDTPTSIATGLAALIAATYPGTTSSGAVVTLPSGVTVQEVRVGTTGITAAEWERQQQPMQITVWSYDPMVRNAIGAAIKQAFAPIAFLTMPDGFGARVRYVNSHLSDEYEKAKLYRRDLFYQVEYATTIEQETAAVVAVTVGNQTMAGAEIRNIDY